MPDLRVIRHCVIHRDERLHCGMPSVVRLPNGKLIVAFRRAPDRRAYGVPLSHCDTASHLVLVRSRDHGETWDAEPELLFAHPLGGSQDPCLFRTSSGTLLCTSYGYVQAAPDWRSGDAVLIHHGPFLFFGGYLARSSDGGRSWQGPFVPDPVDGNVGHDHRGLPYPPFNRGALVSRDDGRILWSVTSHRSLKPARTAIELLESADDGRAWRRISTIAISADAALNESSLSWTPGGDLLCFIRRIADDDYAVMVRSRDGGATWDEPVIAPWRGHPFHALTLPDGRILLIYGYRHAPFGIRARLLEPECRDFATAPEFVLRDDGGSWDIGYPWSVPLDDRHVLVVYYFHTGDGPRHIAGTVVRIG